MMVLDLRGGVWLEGEEGIWIKWLSDVFIRYDGVGGIYVMIGSLSLIVVVIFL